MAVLVVDSAVMVYWLTCLILEMRKWPTGKFHNSTCTFHRHWAKLDGCRWVARRNWDNDNFERNIEQWRLEDSLWEWTSLGVTQTDADWRKSSNWCSFYVPLAKLSKYKRGSSWTLRTNLTPTKPSLVEDKTNRKSQIRMKKISKFLMCSKLYSKFMFKKTF